MQRPPCRPSPRRAQAFGRIRQNKLAYFNGDGNALRGQLVHVHMHECRAYSLFGEMCEAGQGGEGEPGGAGGVASLLGAPEGLGVEVGELAAV